MRKSKWKCEKFGVEIILFGLSDSDFSRILTNKRYLDALNFQDFSFRMSDMIQFSEGKFYCLMSVHLEEIQTIL